jgi:hypothetical protein
MEIIGDRSGHTKLNRIGSRTKRSLMGNKTEEKTILIRKILLKMIMNRLVMTKLNLRLWRAIKVVTQATKTV